MALFFGEKYIWLGLKVIASRTEDGRPTVRAL